MSTSLCMHDIRDFGLLHTPEQPEYGTRLSHALIHDFYKYRCRLGMEELENIQDYIGYVSIVMESIEGFNNLTEQTRNTLLFDGVRYLHTVRETLERSIGHDPHTIAIYARTDTQRNVALVI